MSELCRKVGECSVDNLIAKIHPATETFGVTIPAGAGLLKRGTVLALNGNAYSVLASGTTGKANCVLADDVDATDSNVVAVAYRCGHLNRNALIVAEGYTLTAADIEELRKGGILLSEMI